RLYERFSARMREPLQKRDTLSDLFLIFALSEAFHTDFHFSSSLFTLDDFLVPSSLYLPTIEYLTILNFEHLAVRQSLSFLLKTSFFVSFFSHISPPSLGAIAR
ncbi:hypothetical protein, partial [Microcoleus sp. herbarium12]|uniref:hypothetical protein n=1 Tax=Microcoleus sp. herbarium12 TaxID=3055437 RepID=UPI002FD2F72B